MTPNEWLAIALGFCSLLGSLAVGVRFLVQHYLIELKPNSGSSMRDEQTRQGETIKKLESRIDEIYSLLITRP